MTETDKAGQTPLPKDFDESAADRVEKAPRGKQSPQQEHDNEDQG